MNLMHSSIKNKSLVSGQSSSVLIIGGAGYVGSHMVRNLLERGVTPVVFDNLSTGVRKFVPRGVPFVRGDLRRAEDVARVFKKFRINTVMHFASSIVVPESVVDPLKYYDNNVVAFIRLLSAMKEAQVKNIIFSSTAAVYAEPKKVPIVEDAALGPNNPYGQTKLMCEQLLKDVASADEQFSYVALRYFNVAGAHQSGEIGESHEPETHLIPIVLEVAAGERKVLKIYGRNYPTPDGTCVRDYIHVDDLCDAHYLALKNIQTKARNQVFNLGNQKGYSVQEVVDLAHKITELKIKVEYVARRNGDSARLVASYTKARRVLGWSPKRDLEQMIRSAWAWELKKSAL